MPPEDTPKPRSRKTPILIGLAAIACLLLAAAIFSNPSESQKNQFFADIRKAAVADCDNDPDCLENIRLHFDDCLDENTTAERSGIFTVHYNMDAQGLYDCLNDYQQQTP